MEEKRRDKRRVAAYDGFKVMRSRIEVIHLPHKQDHAGSIPASATAECGAVGSALALEARGRRFKSCHSDRTSFN